MSQESLNKSIDALIEDMFGEEVEKSIDIYKDNKNTADEVVNKAPKGMDDDKRGAGRPAQISDVPKTDMDGKRAKMYDDDITERDGKEEENKEAKKQAKVMDQSKDDYRMKKEGDYPKQAPFKKSLTEEEYNEWVAFKKSKEEEALAKAEELRKAETEEIINKAVAASTNVLKKSIEELKEKNEIQAEMIKSFGRKPRESKSITSMVDAVDKVENHEGLQKSAKTATREEVLDVMEGLYKSKAIKIEHITEFENSGNIYNAEIKALVEKEIRKR